MNTPSSTQLGAIAENLVANALMIESGGRLSPFRPEADDDGIDLLIYDKERGRALPAQVKSRTVTLKKRGREERGNIVHFEVRKATYRADRFAAAILVLTSEQGYRIECAWIIPMTELGVVARKGKSKYVVRASRRPESADRFTKYRCNSPTQLYERISVLLAMAP
jgi:predicted AAA+ superfamily ATPase